MPFALIDDRDRRPAPLSAEHDLDRPGGEFGAFGRRDVVQLAVANAEVALGRVEHRMREVACPHVAAGVGLARQHRVDAVDDLLDQGAASVCLLIQEGPAVVLHPSVRMPERVVQHARPLQAVVDLGLGLCAEE